MDKRHNNHPQNERCDVLAVMATQSIPLSIDAFMRRKKGKFYENFCEFEPLQ
jgi:ribonuclease HI